MITESAVNSGCLVIFCTGINDYDDAKAPCICVEGQNQNQQTHGLMHTYQSTAAGYVKKGERLVRRTDVQTLTYKNGETREVLTTTYGESKRQGVDAVKRAFPESECNEGCLIAQLDAYHNSVGIKDDTPCRAVVTGRSGKKAQSRADQDVKARSERIAKMKTECDDNAFRKQDS